MVVRVRQVTRTTQPQEAARIDFSNEFASNLIAAWAPNSTVNLANGLQATITGESVVGVGMSGVKVTGTSACVELPTRALTSSSITLVTIATLNDVSRFNGLGAFGTTASQNSNWSLVILGYSSGHWQVELFTSDSGHSYPDSGQSDLVAGKPYIFAVSTQFTGETKLYRDGLLAATSSGTDVDPYYNTSNSAIAYGYGDGVTSDYVLHGAFAWDGVLSSSQIAKFSANPWQLFEPEQIIVPVASGTTAYTLTAATSAFTLTGTTTGLKAARKLATSVATFTETGNAAGLAVGRKLSATVSNFTLTGVAAALKADRKLAPSVSPYTLTGNDTTLTYTPTGSKLLTADTVAFTLTGSNANLTVQRKLAPSVSAFTLTGNNSALSYQRKLPAGVGSFTLTGIDVTLSTTGTELPPEQTKGGAGKAKIKKKRLKVQKRELDETLQQLIDDLTEDRNYQSSQEIIEEAVEELKENILDQIQPKELTKEEITEALVVTTVSLKLTAMEVSLSERLDKITKELEKTNRYVQSLEELVILLNNT